MKGAMRDEPLGIPCGCRARRNLPAYERCVEALEHACDMLVSKHIKDATAHDHSWADCSYEPIVTRGRAALAALRGEAGDE